MFDQKPLVEAGDFSEIGKALGVLEDTIKALRNLPCSVHPERKAVALVTFRPFDPRLCQECLDVLVMEDRDAGETITVQTIGCDYEVGVTENIKNGEGPSPEGGVSIPGNSVDNTILIVRLRVR